MEFTGERVIPGSVDPDLYNEHLTRYLFARQLVAGKTVLDLGCGAGYGAALLAAAARNVVAIDVSAEAVGYARRHYAAGNLTYLVADASRLSLATAAFDVVVCFEVIEHLVPQEALLQEARRVLKNDGVLVISTPNRVFYTEERKLANPYHTREFDFEEFRAFLKNSFSHVDLFFQNHVSSVFVGDMHLPLKTVSDLSDASDPAIGSLEVTSNFFLAVCSNAELISRDLQSLIYLSSTANLLREKEQRIESMEKKVSGLDKKILQMQDEYDRQSQWCLDLDQTLKERDATVLKLQHALDELHREFEDRTAWAERLSRENTEKDERIVILQREFEDRTAWALQLDADLQFREKQLESIRQSRLYRLSKALGLVPRI